MLAHRVVVASLFLSSVAAADPRSWTAVKDKLPATTDTVVVIDFKAAFALPSGHELVSPAMFKDPIYDIKKACGIEIAAAVTDLTIVSTTDKNGGFLAFGFDGIDQAKALDCANKYKQRESKGSATVEKTASAKVLDYQLHDKETEHFYASWVDTNVVAFAMSRQKTDGLDAMWKGKAASGDLAAAIGKAPAGAVVWGAFVLHDPDTSWGAVALTADKSNATVHAVFTAKTAAAAAKGAKGLEDTFAAIGKGSDGLAPVGKALVVKVASTTATVDGSFPETKLPRAAIDLFGAMLY